MYVPHSEATNITYTYGTQHKYGKLWHHARNKNSTCTDITGGTTAKVQHFYESVYI